MYAPILVFLFFLIASLNLMIPDVQAVPLPEAAPMPSAAPDDRSTNQQEEFTAEQAYERFDELNTLWQQNYPPDSLLFELDKVLEQADKANLTEVLGNGLELLYESFNQRRLFPEGIKELEARLSTYQRKLSTLHQTETQIYIALLHYGMRELEATEGIFQRLLPTTTDPRLRAVIQTNWANVKSYKSEFEAAVDLHLKASEYYLESENFYKLAGIYLNLGSVFIRLEEPERALEYFLKAKSTAEGIDRPELQITILSNIGIVYKQGEEYEKALETYAEGLKQSEIAGIPLRTAQNLLNIANIYLDTDQPELATEYYERVIAISRKNNIPYGLALGYINSTSAYHAIGEYETALAMADSALAYADRIGLRSEKYPLLEKMSSIYESRGNFEQALEMQKSYIEEYKNVFDEEKRRNIAEIEEKYENEIKDKQLELVEQELKVAGLQNRVLLLALVLLGAISFGTFFYYRSRNRYLQDLYERNVELMTPDPVMVTEALESSALATDSYDMVLYKKILDVFRVDKLHLNPALSLRDISMAVNSNDKYVSATVSAASGLNVSTLINQYRVNDAKIQMVKHPEKNISEVMDTCGFNSRTTFYNSFKKVTGMTPSQFIKRSQG